MRPPARRALAAAALACAGASAALLGLSGFAESPSLSSILLNGSVLNDALTLPAEEVAMGLACVDSAARTYWLLGQNDTSRSATLVGVSGDTGAVVRTCPSPFAWTGAGEHMAWAAERGVLVLGGHDAATGARVVGTLDAASCAFARAVELPAGLESWPASAAAYVPALRALLMLFSDGAPAPLTSTLVVDARLANGTATVWAGPCFGVESLSYDAATGLVYGVGLDARAPGGPARLLVALNASARSCAVVGGGGARAPYVDMLTSEAALDPAGRRLYWVSQPADADDDAQFDLVASSLDDGTTTSVPLVGCGGGFAIVCPWQLGWLAAAAAAAAVGGPAGQEHARQ